MKKLKVMTVVGTRPEIIRLSIIINKLDASPAIDHVLVHTGQNYDYELNEIFFEDLGIRKPDHFLNAAGKNATSTAGQILINIDPILEQENPDAMLILGDTNSSLCAIAAKKRHIPIFHMEAGNRSFDQRVPEETNRKIVDHIADINLPYSDIAREHLLAEGLRPDRIVKTGSPMYEVLQKYMPKVQKSTILSDLGLKKGEYFVMSTHREENLAQGKFSNMMEVANSVASTYKMPVIVSTHPRTRKMIEARDTHFDKQVRLMKPLGLTDYLALQINAKAVLSDSGTISEESSMLNFRALNLRDAHERPEAMEEASVMMVGSNLDRVMQALAQLDDQEIGDKRNFRIVSDYSMPNVSDKIVRIIISYTDYIKRVVWNELN